MTESVPIPTPDTNITLATSPNGSVFGTTPGGRLACRTRAAMCMAGCEKGGGGARKFRCCGLPGRFAPAQSFREHKRLHVQRVFCAHAKNRRLYRKPHERGRVGRTGKPTQSSLSLSLMHTHHWSKIGTRITYSRDSLLQLRDQLGLSPPPSDMPAIPGITAPDDGCDDDAGVVVDSSAHGDATPAAGSVAAAPPPSRHLSPSWRRRSRPSSASRRPRRPPSPQRGTRPGVTSS